MTAVGRAWVPCPSHDGANAMTAHQSLDAAATRSATLIPQTAMDTRAAIASVVVAMDLPDVVHKLPIGSRTTALRARAPGVVAGRRDTERIAHDPHGVVGAAIFDEA